VPTRRRCASCLSAFAPKRTGRPPRYCSNRCRQAGFRRVTKLQGSTAERVLRRHGFSGERLRLLAHRVAQDELRRRGAYLGDRYQDLVAYLCEQGCKTASRYDEARPQATYGSNGGDPFESYLSDILARRVVDFWRSKSQGYVDQRYYREHGQPIALMGDEIDTLRAVHGDAGAELVEAEEQDLELAAEGLAGRLSEKARETLELVALPVARGYGTMEIMRATGFGPKTQRVRLEALREELATASV
jgi:hypothetical protein